MKRNEVACSVGFVSCLAFMLTIFLYSGSAFGADVRVPDDYGTVRSAIENCASGDSVKVRSGKFIESNTLSGHKAVVFSGGWDDDFSDSEGHASALGALTLASGAMTVYNLELDGLKSEPSLTLMVAAGTDSIEMA